MYLQDVLSPMVDQRIQRWLLFRSGYDLLCGYLTSRSNCTQMLIKLLAWFCHTVIDFGAVDL